MSSLLLDCNFLRSHYFFIIENDQLTTHEFTFTTQQIFLNKKPCYSICFFQHRAKSVASVTLERSKKYIYKILTVLVPQNNFFQKDNSISNKIK